MDMQEYCIICRDYTKIRRKKSVSSKQMVCFAVIDYLFGTERLYVSRRKTICSAPGNYRCTDRRLYMEQKGKVCSAIWNRWNGCFKVPDCPDSKSVSFAVKQRKRNALLFDSFFPECRSLCYSANSRDCFLFILPAVHRETKQAAAFENTFCHFERAEYKLSLNYAFIFFLSIFERLKAIPDERLCSY